MHDRTSLDKSRASAQELPFDVLDYILELATTPSYLLDHTLQCDPQSAWSQDLRRKKAVVLVCKSWYQAGIARLYENVTFRRCGQVLGLWWALQNNPVLASYVRRVKTDFYVIQGFRDACEEDLTLIYAACPKLIEVHTRSASCEGSKRLVLPPSLLHYECNWEHISDIFKDWNAHRNLFSSLTSLAINFVDEIPPTSADLTFPVLEKLRLYVGLVCGQRKSWTDFLTLPSLRSFAVYPSYLVEPPNMFTLMTMDKFIGIADPILKKHGSQLRSLQFLHPHFLDRSTDFPTILCKCPNVSHLCLYYPRDALEHIKTHTHPQIRWLDFYDVYDPDVHPDGFIKILRESKGFPKLEGVRFHRVRFCWDVNINLSQELCHPVFFKDDFDMNYPGVHITYRNGVLSMGLLDDHCCKGFEMHDEDSEWEYASSSGYSGNSLGEMLDHDDGLARFRNSVRRNEDDESEDDDETGRSSDVEMVSDDSFGDVNIHLPIRGKLHHGIFTDLL